MAHENCTLWAAGYGQTTVKIDGLSRGLMIMGSEEEGRFNRAAYFTAATDDDFGIQCVFKEWQDQVDFANWMRGYIYKKADPDGGVAHMVVQCTKRNFLQAGVPRAGIAFGKRADSIRHRLAITFTGTQDPSAGYSGSKFIAPVAQPGPDGTIPPAKDQPSQWFFPQSPHGFGTLEEDQLLFDSAKGEVANAANSIAGVASGIGKAIAGI